jgi:enolase
MSAQTQATLPLERSLHENRRSGVRTGSKIVSVVAREILTGRGHPGIEATVVTENGAAGVAVAVAGTSTGEHEVQFTYDGGRRYGGKGVLKAVENVARIMAPALMRQDAADQRRIDSIILELDGTPNKAKLGGNATASVSGAVLKAGAASLGIPLYQHIGGVNACTRYGGGRKSGGKPTYTFLCYGFETFSQAAYAGWEVTTALHSLIRDKYGFASTGGPMFDFAVMEAGAIKHDRQIWDLMVEAIKVSGHEGKIGFQVDMAAGTYYDKAKDRYVGILSQEDKTTEDLIELYTEMVEQYPLVILEDPLDENDYEGHARLTKKLGITVIGDDLFTTSTERLKHGIEMGACNTMLLKVNQVGTVSEAFEAVQLAYINGYGVAPCASRGEGEAIADYGVGLNSGMMSGGGLGQTVNRFKQIEAELGNRARFLGKDGFKGFRNRIS